MNQEKEMRDVPVIHQIASKHDCAVVLVEHAIAPDELERIISILTQHDISAVLRLVGADRPPWQDSHFRKFQEAADRRQLVIVGAISEPSIVGLCLFSLEEGYQTFCVDTDLSNDSPARGLNLDRLARSGVALLSVDQLLAEFSFGNPDNEY